MKEKLKNIREKAGRWITICRDMYNRGIARGKQDLADFIAFVERKLKAEKRERNRFILLSLSLIFLADYIMICVHTDRWFFDIFPSLPALEKKSDVTIYFPATNGTVSSENRRIPHFDSEENLAVHLLKEVRQGSRYENTRIMVPVDMMVKKVWFISGEDGNRLCVIDIDPVMIKEDISVVPGSEKLFREALTRTITGNIPRVSDVILLEKGIPRIALWDVR